MSILRRPTTYLSLLFALFFPILLSANFIVDCASTQPASSSTAADGRATITVNATVSINAPVTVQIENSTGETIYNQSINDFPIALNLVDLGAGTYQVSVQSRAGTGSCDFVVKNANCDLAVSVNPSSRTLRCAGEPASITATATGGTPPYRYEWTGGLNGATINVAEGNWQVTAIDAAGCQATTTAVHTAPAPIQLNCTPEPASNISATDGKIRLNINNGVFPFTIIVTNEQQEEVINFPLLTVPTITFSDLPAGSYTITATDQSGCTQTCGTTIEVSSCDLMATVADQPAGCNGEAATLTVEIVGGLPPYDISWDNGSTGASVAAIGGTQRTVTVRDQADCEVMASGEVFTPTSLEVVCNNIQDVSITGLADGAVDFTVSGGTAPYSYSAQVVGSNDVYAQGSVPEGVNVFSVSAFAAGSYITVITDANGCQTNCAFSINEPNCDLSVVIPTADLVCATDQNGVLTPIVMGGRPPYTYQWQGGQSTASLPNLGSGFYALSVTDADNCRKVATGEVSAPNPLVLDCNTIEFVNNLTVNYSIAGGTPPYVAVIAGTGLEQTHNAGGEFSFSDVATDAQTLTITDDNDCVISCTINPQTNGCTDLILSCNATEIEGITILSYGISGGEPPYAVSITGTMLTRTHDDSGNFSITGLPASAGNVVVVDNNGCSTDCSINATQDICEDFSAIAFFNSLVSTPTVATVEAIPRDGTLPYRFQWSNGQTTRFATAAYGSTMTVTITDAVGCQDVDSVRIPDSIDGNQTDNDTNTDTDINEEEEMEEEVESNADDYPYTCVENCNARGDGQNYITRLKIGRSRLNSNNDNGFRFYPSTFLFLQARGTYNVQLLAEATTVEADSLYWYMAMDINADGDFADAGEELFMEKGTYEYRATIQLPEVSQQQSTCTRIAVSTTPITACEDVTSGEVEDYIFILNNSRFTPPTVKGELKQKTVRIAWFPIPDSEEQTERYSVERSTDNENFTTISEQRSEAVSKQEIYDHYPVVGDNYYRLLTFRNNGEVYTSETVKITYQLDESKIQLLPNPAQHETLLYLPMPKPELIRVQIYNQLGQLVHEQAEYHEPNKLLPLDVSALDNGLYFIQVGTQQRKQQIEKLVVKRLD